MIYRR